MTYQIKPATEFTNGFVINLNGLVWIPINEANKDYQTYLEWVAEGNTAEEWNPGGN